MLKFKSASKIWMDENVTIGRNIVQLNPYKVFGGIQISDIMEVYYKMKFRIIN